MIKERTEEIHRSWKEAVHKLVQSEVWMTDEDTSGENRVGRAHETQDR